MISLEGYIPPEKGKRKQNLRGQHVALLSVEIGTKVPMPAIESTLNHPCGQIP